MSNHKMTIEFECADDEEYERVLRVLRYEVGAEILEEDSDASGPAQVSGNRKRKDS